VSESSIRWERRIENERVLRIVETSIGKRLVLPSVDGGVGLATPVRGSISTSVFFGGASRFGRVREAADLCGMANVDAASEPDQVTDHESSSDAAFHS
jgi:hypothetical protein